MRSLPPALLFAALNALMGCATSPEDISWKSSAYLCQQYYSLLTRDYKNPKILDELLNRGIGACTDSALSAARKKNEIIQMPDKRRLPNWHRSSNSTPKPVR
ncbi:uncharacterized protein METZ01_LOCUS367286 [marine metagenome]|uniref:Lipoprotein n=1 Tax=marine metagenome TaxID=408172 RepID=A0A382SXZ9_9ZZZZ